nr:MAG TPA: hypothetical protein [Caudoviricetes sp.]
MRNKHKRRRTVNVRRLCYFTANQSLRLTLLQAKIV